MVSDYTIEQLNASHFEDVARLHYEVYGRQKPWRYWQIKYNTSWTGVSYAGYIAYDHLHNPIAFYAVIPCFIDTRQGPVLSAQSADTMTHPSHQKKGLFIQLAKMTIDLCRNKGIRLLFGFPNRESHHGFIKKLGWRQVEAMQSFIFKIKTPPFAWIETLPLVKYVYVFYRHLLLHGIVKKDCCGIKNSVLAEGYDGLLRNNAYLDNKGYNKTYVVAINDWNIWMKVDKNMIIGDMEKGTTDFRNILRQLKRMAARLGIRQLIFQLSKHTALYNDLLSVSKGNEGFAPIFFIIDPTIDVSSIKFTLADIDIF